MFRKIFQIIVYIFALIGFALVAVYFAVQFGFTKTPGIIDNQHDYFKNQAASAANAYPGYSFVQSANNASSTSISPSWQQGEEWQTLKQAIIKDRDSIDSAYTKTGVPARIIVDHLVVEQLRLFHSNRELFKQIFAPLKILAVQSQFSWGVMGIKQDTAKQIEVNLKNPQSVWYLGLDYGHLLDFNTSDHDTERFARLTDPHDRSYSYLYLALMIKEIENQWQKAGYTIDNLPDVIATLCNIGFGNSNPNSNPQSGGAEIDIGTTTYSFGSLAGAFYSSNELTTEFPRP